MKAKIVYIAGDTFTTMENKNLSFIEFCERLFEKKIYVSVPEKNETGYSLAINTNNILFVEEMKEEEE